MHRLAGQCNDLKRIGQIVYIHHVNLTHPRDLAEIIIRSRQPAVTGFGKHQQFLVNALNFFNLCKYGVINLHVDYRVRLHLVEYIESPPATVALELVGRI